LDGDVVRTLTRNCEAGALKRTDNVGTILHNAFPGLILDETSDRFADFGAVRRAAVT
jgi:hypothetical protein